MAKKKKAPTKSAKKKKATSNRGGKRVGAGRKAMDPEDKMISISFALSAYLRDRIDERRHLETVGRSTLLRRYAEEGLAKKPKIPKKKASRKACRTIPKP